MLFFWLLLAKVKLEWFHIFLIADTCPIVIGEAHVMFQVEPMDELKKQIIEQTYWYHYACSDLGGGLSLV